MPVPARTVTRLPVPGDPCIRSSRPPSRRVVGRRAARGRRRQVSHGRRVAAGGVIGGGRSRYAAPTHSATKQRPQRPDHQPRNRALVADGAALPDRGARQRQPPSRRLARRDRRLAAARRAAHAVVELLDQDASIDTEKRRVAAQEAACVGRLGQLIEPLLFEGRQIARTDPGLELTFRKLEALALACVAKCGPDIDHAIRRVVVAQGGNGRVPVKRRGSSLWHHRATRRPAISDRAPDRPAARSTASCGASA